jgi:hypothetical protein
MSKIQNILIETKKVSIYLDKISIYLKKISITFKYLKNLNLSQKSPFVLTILIKISTNINLDWKILILKISTEKKKKVSLNRQENLDTKKKLVSTPRTFSISISIGLDCLDHQG